MGYVAHVLTRGVLLVSLLTALVPAAAHADGWVTVHYSGTQDESFIYQPKDPAVWQESLHFTWDERQIFHLTAPDKVTPERPQVTVGGRFTATHAPPNTHLDCSFGIGPRPGAPSPMHIYWPGSGSVGATATMPIIGTYIQALSPTLASPACTVNETGGAGVSGTAPDAAIQYHEQALIVNITAKLGGPTVTRTFPTRTYASPDGGYTQRLNATMTVSNSARRPPDSPAAPNDVTQARKQAKLAALDALKDTFQRALYPCGVGAGVGTALIAAGPVGAAVGGTMSALGTPLCIAYLKTIYDEVNTVRDPPQPGYRKATRIKPVRAGAVRLPACPAPGASGSPGDVCRRLAPAAQKLLRTTRETAAAAAAIDITISRGTAALKAHDRAASALQDRTLTTLGRSFSARRRAEKAAARNVAQILRAAGLSVSLDGPAAATALQRLRSRLIAGRVPAAKLTAALGGAPQVTARDLLTALDG